MENFSPAEINALIADRHGNNVHARVVDGAERFFLMRDGVEVQPADYASNPAYLDGEAAVGIVPDDATGRELFQRSSSTLLSPYGRAAAWVDAFVASPEERLAIIRARKGPR